VPFHLPHLSLPASHIKILKHSGSSVSPPSLRLRPLLSSRERKHSGGHGKPTTELCHPSTHLLPICVFGLRFSTQKNETQPGSHGNRASSSTPWPSGFRSVFSRWLTAAVTPKKKHTKDVNRQAPSHNHRDLPTRRPTAASTVTIT